MTGTDTGDNKPKAIILDMDGVVIDSEPLHVKADKKLFTEYGVTLSPADWPGLKGLTPLAVYELIRSKYGFDDSFEVFHTKKDAYLAEIYREELTLFPDFLPLIQRFKGLYAFALTTSTHRSITELVLTKFQIENIFQVVTTSDDVTNGKPDPEPYSKTIYTLGFKPVECVVIEDSVNGIKSAKGAGARCIAVATSFGSDELMEADIVVSRLGDITENMISSPQ